MSNHQEVPRASGIELPKPALSAKELVNSRGRHPKPFIYLGGNTDRAPTEGFRASFFELGVNLGPTWSEIIRVERRGCIECREELRKNRGALCIGYISPKGGPGKSVNATMATQLLLEMNPGMERPVLVDVNTSQTTLDELNGIPKELFLTGKYWTMKTLYEYIVERGGPEAIKHLEDINYKLAYRRDPQLPVIPLLLGAGKFGSREAVLTGDQYEVVLRVLKKFFTVIVHDFGTDLQNELTFRALSKMHILAVITKPGVATVKMVPDTLETLHVNLPHLLQNTTVIFNQQNAPSPADQRAIIREKAGKSIKPSGWLWLKGQAASSSEVATPGQALSVINDMIDLGEVIYPLEHYEVVLVGHDRHLERESKLNHSEVSDPVSAQLWTALHRMQMTRVEYESRFPADMERDEMIVPVDSVEVEEEIAHYPTSDT